MAGDGRISSAEFASLLPSVYDLAADPIVDLSGKKSQGQTENARSVTDHATDGAMGLARVGGAQRRGDGRRAVEVSERHEDAFGGNAVQGRSR